MDEIIESKEENSHIQIMSSVKSEILYKIVDARYVEISRNGKKRIWITWNRVWVLDEVYLKDYLCIFLSP